MFVRGAGRLERPLFFCPGARPTVPPTWADTLTVHTCLDLDVGISHGSSLIFMEFIQHSTAQ